MHCFLCLLSFFLLGVCALNPIVFFPGYSFSKLNVSVTNGTVSGCPSNGTYVAEYQYNLSQNGFDERCMFYYLNLSYNENAALGKKFSNRPDVSITIPGREAGDVNLCVGGQGLYNNFFNQMIANGYTTTGGASGGATLTAACYDWRIDPANDAIDGPSFMANTQTIIETTYKNGGNSKVWLIGHSNGPIMTLYFLNQMSDVWKQQYIAGFIPLSGDFAGVGAFYGVLVDGLSIYDFSFNIETAPIMEYWSGNLISCAQPSIFQSYPNVHIVTTVNPAKNYSVTPADIDTVLNSTGRSFALTHWREYVGLVTVDKPPNVYTYALWGAGFDTAVGIVIPNWSNTSILDYNIQTGDINQEFMDNESPKKWATTMPSGCFDYFQLDGVNHFELTGNNVTISKILSVINKGILNITCNSMANTTTEGGTTGTGSTTSFASSVHVYLVIVISSVFFLIVV